MLQEYLVPGKGIQVLDNGLTEEDTKVAEQKKKEMQFNIDGVAFLGVCRICGLYIRATDKHFYFENKDGVGNVLVDVVHCRCC